MESEKVNVVFRMDPPKEGGACFALFPDDIADDHGRVTCYQHLGQHGAAFYSACIHASRPAKPEEYADLKAELESIGYIVTVRKRRA